MPEQLPYRISPSHFRAIVPPNSLVSFPYRTPMRGEVVLRGITVGGEGLYSRHPAHQLDRFVHIDVHGHVYQVPFYYVTLVR